MSWMASVPAGNCCPSLGLVFWLGMCVTFDLTRGLFRFRCCPSFWWGRRFLPGFFQVICKPGLWSLGAALASWDQDSGFASDGMESFHQRCGPGHGDKDMRGI